MIAVYILLAIVILLFMILMHELGHYIAGKILKFKINEFSIGFGFPIFSKTNKKTGEKFSLRIFPLGGYCSFDGEDGENDQSPTAFNKQKPWKRIIVLLGGVTMNFLTAIIFSWILLSTIGYDVPQIQRYSQEYLNPYMEEDVITHINGEKIDFAFGGNYVTMVNEQRANAQKEYQAWIDEYYELHEEYPTQEELNEYLNETTESGNGSFYTFEMTVKRKAEEGQKVDLTIKVYPVIEFEEVTETAEDGSEVVTQKQQLYVFVGLESSEDETPCTVAYVYNAWEGFCRSFEMAFRWVWFVLKSLWMLITFQIPITIKKE